MLIEQRTDYWWRCRMSQISPSNSTPALGIGSSTNVSAYNILTNSLSKNKVQSPHHISRDRQWITKQYSNRKNEFKLQYIMLPMFATSLVSCFYQIVAFIELSKWFPPMRKIARHMLLRTAPMTPITDWPSHTEVRSCLCFSSSTRKCWIMCTLQMYE